MYGTDTWVAYTWSHLGMTLSSTGVAKIYVNGTLQTSGTVTVPRAVTRDLCSLSGNTNNQGDANAYFDDVMIFSKDITASSVQLAMNTYYAV